MKIFWYYKVFVTVFTTVLQTNWVMFYLFHHNNLLSNCYVPGTMLMKEMQRPNEDSAKIMQKTRSLSLSTFWSNLQADIKRLVVIFDKICKSVCMYIYFHKDIHVHICTHMDTHMYIIVPTHICTHTWVEGQDKNHPKSTLHFEIWNTRMLLELCWTSISSSLNEIGNTPLWGFLERVFFFFFMPTAPGFPRSLIQVLTGLNLT